MSEHTFNVGETGILCNLEKAVELEGTPATVDGFVRPGDSHKFIPMLISRFHGYWVRTITGEVKSIYTHQLRRIDPDEFPSDETETDKPKETTT